MTHSSGGSWMPMGIVMVVVSDDAAHTCHGVGRHRGWSLRGFLERASRARPSWTAVLLGPDE